MSPARPLTVDMLVKAGISAQTAATILGPLRATFEKYGWATAYTQAMFIAQCAHESSFFTQTAELLSYSSVDNITNAFARLKEYEPLALEPLVRNPQALANAAYAHRNGNGDPASGDGWRYRGGGWLQLTGRANYLAASQALGIDYVADPERVRTNPADSCATAAWFYKSRGCDRMATVDETTQAINGGQNGLLRRRMIFGKAFAALGGGT